MIPKNLIIQVVSEYSQGLTIREIGIRHNLTKSQVIQILYLVSF